MKNKSKKTTPLYTTHPIPLGEEVSAPAEEDAVEMAKKWVDENRL